MTTDQKIIQNELGLLKFAQTLGNVSVRHVRSLAIFATVSIGSKSCMRPVENWRFR